MGLSAAGTGGGTDLSIVTVCMNRLEHLRSTAQHVAAWPGHQEHLIVDWSSAVPVRREQLPADPRIRLLRVEGEASWNLCRAYNFAVARAGGDWILKLDADTLFAISEASDSRLKDQIQIRVRDYAGPGLHLYSFTWKPWVVQLYGKHGPDVGFIADTLPRNWVEVDGHGYKNIVVARTNKKIQDFYRSKG